jgi:hypothetical protein
MLSFSITCTVAFEIFWRLLNLKEIARKELKFGLAQVVDILLRKWFPLEPKTRLSKFDPNDEDDDLEFFDP